MPADRDHPGSAHRLLIQLAIWTVLGICQAQVVIRFMQVADGRARSRLHADAGSLPDPVGTRGLPSG